MNATFLESMVIQVRRPGDATPGVGAGAGAVRSPEGEMPGAAAVESITLTTTVAEIDREGRSVTLENPDGTRRVVHVRNPEQFDHVAVGDRVEITLTEALAISVERPVPLTLLRVFAPFACGYFVSYFCRTVNAVLSPDLVRDLGIDASRLGLLTGAYFLAFALAQLPLGVLY